MQWLLIVALVVTMQPLAPTTSTAAPGDPVYFQFSDYSINPLSPTDVNMNVIDIRGSFNQVKSLSYQVRKIVNGAVVESSNSSTQPIISDGNTFRFSAVTIYEGLNEIKVMGVNSFGNVVSETAYVNFSNVPLISEVKLSDGRVFVQEQPLITNRPNEALTVRVANATEVTINGVQMFGGSGYSYLLNNLNLVKGLNKLVIRAKNGTKTYEVTRNLVYFDGSITAYGVTWNNASPTPPISLDGNPTLTAAVNATISANVIMATSTGTGPSFEISIVDAAGVTVVPAVSASYNLTDVTKVGTYSIYPIKTAANLGIAADGKYFIQIHDASVAGSPVFKLPFSYRDANSPYILSIGQAYDVSEAGTAASYSNRPISFVDRSTTYTSPLWVVLDIEKLDASTSVSVSAATYSGPVSSADFNYSVYTVTGTGNEKSRAIKIDKLPTGTVDLTFNVIHNSKITDTIKRTITFIPAPSIQINSIYNGQVFESTTMPVIRGKLTNFDLFNAKELETVNVILNGKKVNMVTDGKIYDVTTEITNDDGAGNPYTYKPGDFRIVPSTTNGLILLPGANTLVFEGIANGVPVTTTFTVYFFSKDNPGVTSIRPVPYTIDPTLDLSSSDPNSLRKFNDISTKFAATGDKEYSTTERSLDLLFDVKDITSLEIQINGTATAKATISTETATAGKITTEDVPLPAPQVDNTKLYIEVPSDSSAGTLAGRAVTDYTDGSYHYKMRISEIELPKTGKTSITITARKGTVSVSETITIIRDLSPFILLSPRLPNESVINANFLKVSIKAEGATSVLLGKVPMVKDLNGDVFRYELKNLKAGMNTIKFTVMQGTQKTNGSFTVNYAADNSVAAEYKAKLPTSGKLSIFKGELSVAFPKNTFLRQANIAPGQDVKTVNLFDAQELYFGIADRTDGRTVKRYNAVGEIDVNDGTPLDGILMDLPASEDAKSYLMPRANFNFASNLFWVDAGYFKGTGLVNDYELVDAMHPYVKGDDFFYLRAFDPNRWLESSQRGTITIKYDTKVVDALAAT